MMKVYINQAGYRPDSKKTAVISKVLKAVDKTDMKADDASKNFQKIRRRPGSCLFALLRQRQAGAFLKQLPSALALMRRPVMRCGRQTFHR